ncbi:inner centromere protein A isoform X2 [Eupeodes corollae]|uniref:inner centromere protein A isoform X2 n=1 Tax=Eupeodes corollae TaxID=290404 RepID=UPI00249280E9|nr:inner centromere protein A isoform X2 [Eupeodes corollae]
MNKDLDFDPSIPEDERRFYLKAYPNVNHVRERKVHCTICKMHIGTAPSNESIIRMHPILRVTHCKKCHDFYNSGEFSKGEDGSELYCRWCGQGGEVYCCSNCPFVFCKSCIISNLSRGVVADIEQNENWSCFNCAPKMLWPLRAQHWALIKFIDKQKKAILNSNLSDAEIKVQMTKDRSLCCKIKKVSGYGTDSSDSSDISLSRLKKKAGEKRSRKSLSKEDLSGGASPAQAKKAKGNDEVVCTPDVLSMLEPECTLTVPTNSKTPTNSQPSTSSPKIMSIQPPAKRINTPPLLVRNAQPAPLRSLAPAQVLKKTVVGPRLPSGQGSDYTTPVYHTINGYRIDLNSAAQQETVRLPNGKLIQVKRQGTGPQQVTTVQNAPTQHSTPTRVIHNISGPNVSPIASVPTQQIVHSSGGHIIRTQLPAPRSIAIQNTGLVNQFQIQHQQQQQQQHQQQQQQSAPVQPQFQQITIRQPNQQIATIRYQGNSTPQVANMMQNGTMQILNGTQVTNSAGQLPNIRPMPTFIKQFFPNTPLGQSRTQLQSQIFNAMEICQHLMGKLQTLTNSNAYKTAKSMTDVKELYIHLSYLLTYAIGRFKGLQDNCLADMRDLGFTNDANSLENGQLAAEKQASDAEEDEITIVEPKTDTINLDSDNEDDLPPPPSKSMGNHPAKSVITSNSNLITHTNQVRSEQSPPIVTPTTTTNADDELTAEYDFSKVASLLAGMLEVELTEGGNESPQAPKKPRKKTTNKPNPTLVKQKEIQERERLENIKKNCVKLKMEVQIPLNKVEDIYEYAKPMLEELKHEKLKADENELSENETSKKEEEVETKNEQEGDKKAEETSENDIEKSNPEKEIQDKEDSEEMVVVLVEEADTLNVNEENDKRTADSKNDEMEVEDADPIDQEESQNSERELVQKENSVQPDQDGDVIQPDQEEDSVQQDEGEDSMQPDEEGNSVQPDLEEDSMQPDQEEDSVPLNHVIDSELPKESVENNEKNNESEGSDESKNKEEVVASVEVNDEDAENNEEEEEETEMLIDSANKKNSELPLNTKLADQSNAENDTDPLKSDDCDKDQLLPVEDKQNKNDKDVENNIESSSLSHNYNTILGRTEVV